MILIFTVGDDTHDIHENCPIFKTPFFTQFSPPLSIYVQNYLTPLTLDIQFQMNIPLPSPNNNQPIKRKQSKDQYYMLSGPSFRLLFVFSINSLIFPGFPLTSFHLAEASLSAVLWLYTLVCSVVNCVQLFTFLVLFCA